MSNVESIKSNVVHAAELFDSKYFDNVAKTACGRDIVLMRTTEKKVTCKRCLKALKS